METSSGTAFTAIIAIILTLTASRSWKIIRFAIHLSRRHDVPRSAMIREQEVHLRAAETDLGTFWHMVTVLRAWKNFGQLVPKEVHDALIRSSRRSTWRILIAAIIHFTIWAYLAVQVPDFLITRNPLVLMNNDRCSIFDYNRMDPSVELQSAISIMTSYAASEALQYYDNCYRKDTGANAAQCSYLSKSTLPWKESMVKCPFDSNVCLGSGDVAVVLDTGELSPDFFGLNTPVQTIITVEKRMTCAPLNWTYFSIDVQGVDWVALNFTNGTFEFGFEDFFPIFHPGQHTGYYVTQSHRRGWNRLDGHRWAGAPNGKDPPQLSPLLRRTDGDVSLFVIQMDGVLFLEPVDDPVFAANRVHPDLLGGMSYYDADETFGMIGCVDQVQFHNKRSQKRSLWQSPGLENILWYAMLGTEKDTSNTIQFLAEVLRYSVLSFFPSAWDASTILQAKESSTELGVQLALPSDHWKAEVRRWFQISLAKAQRDTIGITVGQSYGANTSLMKNLLEDPNVTNTQNFFCNSITVHSSSHISITVLELLTFAVLTSLVWVLSFCDGLTHRLIFRKRPHAVLAWHLDHPAQLLEQLHRLLHVPSDNDGAIGTSFGTVGVPVLKRVNGSELRPQFERVSTVQSAQLNATVETLTGKYILQYIIELSLIYNRTGGTCLTRSGF